MSKLIKVMADIIRKKIVESTNGGNASLVESRFIFHGPPIEILNKVYLELLDQAAKDGVVGINNIPVLLQLEELSENQKNPAIGESGVCDDKHLLNVRNDPNKASFLALVPPGIQANMSVASTTEAFGLRAKNNSRHASFDEWWEDDFVTEIVSKGIESAGIEAKRYEEVLKYLRNAASSIDEASGQKSGRVELWKLISRIFSIESFSDKSFKPESFICYACGLPNPDGIEVSNKEFADLYSQLSTELSDGFRTAISRIKIGATVSQQLQLDRFLEHIQLCCEFPSAFQISPEAYYLSNSDLSIQLPSEWWAKLTFKVWSELLATTSVDLSVLVIRCKNSLNSAIKGGPHVVVEDVMLEMFSEDTTSTSLFLIGGSINKNNPVELESPSSYLDTKLSAHSSPMTYKLTAPNCKSVSLKVISLKSWSPGLFVSCRGALKSVPPKKNRNKSSSSNFDYEGGVTLPGTGRYEMLIYISPNIQIKSVIGLGAEREESDSSEDQVQNLTFHKISDHTYSVEIDAESNYQLEVLTFNTNLSINVKTRIYVTCEEVKEIGCKSEFELMIRLNRRHLDKLDVKPVVQIDRNQRISMLQSWLLDEATVKDSYLPLVMSDDYASKWYSPDWNSDQGRIFSEASFLLDPRPPRSHFQPPIDFIDSRIKIAKRIRSNDEFGLIESSKLGKWLEENEDFQSELERYIDSYNRWLIASPEVALWSDVVAVCPRESGGRTLDRTPDALIVSPLHPLRLAWHCLAQNAMYKLISASDEQPCPAVSILDPDCIPDLITLPIQSPTGDSGFNYENFLSVECSSDYWSVLWNGSRLSNLTAKSEKSPFDQTFGLVIGGISSGFSPAQVSKALDDISGILSAKPSLSIMVSSSGGSNDSCNEGIVDWAIKRLSSTPNEENLTSTGTRFLDVYDERGSNAQPNEATISNLSADTDNKVRWYLNKPISRKPDIGIIAQLDTSQPSTTDVGHQSSISIGGLIRHRIRRQLHASFISESKQAAFPSPSGDVLADKIIKSIDLIEGASGKKIGWEFSPNVHSISNLLVAHQAKFVAVSSSVIDPACFLGGSIPSTYLWDYDLPAYSQKSGDTSGYYLLSNIRQADQESLSKVMRLLPEIDQGTVTQHLESTLIEVAKRGIPTVRGLSGDDTGAVGNLGLFIAARLLQDEFRTQNNFGSLLPIFQGDQNGENLCIIVPVDPFRAHLADLSKSLFTDKLDLTLSRPDLLAIGINFNENNLKFKLTPIEVKCRISSVFSATESVEALKQSKALSNLFIKLLEASNKFLAWKLTTQHLLISFISFGLRVYSQQEKIRQRSSWWSHLHERATKSLLEPNPIIEVDIGGRLIVIDNSSSSTIEDHDQDGFTETIIISSKNASQIIAGDPSEFYKLVSQKVGTWGLLPKSIESKTVVPVQLARESVHEINKQKNPISLQPSRNDVTGEEGISNSAAAAQINSFNSTSNSEVKEKNEDGNENSGINLILGHTIDGFQEREVSIKISDTKLNNLNIGVVGDLGTGKTQLLKSIIYQISSAKDLNRGVSPNFLIFDYKKDYSDPNSSADFISATNAKVIAPYRLPFNIFDTRGLEDSPQPWLDRFRFFSDILSKIYSNIGPVQRDKFKQAVKAAYSAKAGVGCPTIYDVHDEYKQLMNGKTDSVMSIIGDIVDMEIFEPDVSKTISFNKFLDGVVVIALNKLGQDDNSKNLLVAIMLNMFYENMLITPKRPYLGTNPQLRFIDSYLLVDEADNIMSYEFEVLKKLLLQGREFGVGVVLASQYLSHFKTSGEDYKTPLFSWFLHKVPNVTASEIGGLGLTDNLAHLADRVKNLENHHSLLKTIGFSGEIVRDLPFYKIQIPF